MTSNSFIYRGFDQKYPQIMLNPKACQKSNKTYQTLIEHPLTLLLLEVFSNDSSGSNRNNRISVPEMKEYHR